MKVAFLMLLPGGRSGIGWWKVCFLASIVKLGIEMQECCPLISAIAPQLNFCFELCNIFVIGCPFALLVLRSVISRLNSNDSPSYKALIRELLSYRLDCLINSQFENSRNFGL
ncbi:hypothetical protein QQ045_010656 [Rhodiola kirilowii]